MSGRRIPRSFRVDRRDRPRSQPLDNVTLDVAGYYSDYDDLRGTLLVSSMPIPCFSGAPGPCTLETLRFDNSEVAKAWGIEVAAGWVVSEYWKLDGAYTYMHVEVEDRAGVPLTSEGGTTPDHQLRLSSLINLPWNLEFDTTFYWIGELPAQVHLHDTPTSVGIDAYE